MASETEIERARAIMDRASLIYALDNVNPIISDILDQITLDAQFLCDRLWSAWATVEAYQQELRELYDDNY